MESLTGGIFFIDVYLRCSYIARIHCVNTKIEIIKYEIFTNVPQFMQKSANVLSKKYA